MKKLLVPMLVLLVVPLHSVAHAATFHAMFETDPGGADSLVLGNYDSLVDLTNLNASTAFLLPSLSGGNSVGGLTYDGSQFHLLTETDPGGAFNQQTLSSYNSLADLASLNSVGPSSILPAFSTGNSVGGLAYDGSQFHLLTETDPGGTFNQQTLSSYNSLADLASLNAVGPSSILPAFSTGNSVGGLAYDGSQFHLLTETDPGGTFNQQTLSSYNSLADLIGLNAVGPSTILPVLSPDLSVRALAAIADPDPGVGAVPEPTGALLFLVGLSIVARRRSR